MFAKDGKRRTKTMKFETVLSKVRKLAEKADVSNVDASTFLKVMAMTIPARRARE